MNVAANTRRLIVVLCLCWSSWGPSQCSQAAPIQVETHDGRTLTGEVDSRSDARTLWLRHSEQCIVLTTAIPWQNVVGGRAQGKSLSASELRRSYPDLATDAPRGLLAEYELPNPGNFLQGPPRTRKRLRPRFQIATVECEAQLANLNRTVDLDGVRLFVTAADIHGTYGPVCGTVTVRLLGQTIDSHTGKDRIRELERWNRELSYADFAEGVAVVNLPFRHIRPDANPEICTAAMLNVRLGVRGEGNFESTIPLPLREYNPLRDALQYQEGSRFFRDELTRNVRHDGPRARYQGYDPQLPISTSRVAR